jgi:argininosuccinate lyase
MARKKAWEGRLDGTLDPVFESFNSSLSTDRCMLADELAQDQAWARALAATGVYTKAELARVQRALNRMGREAARGEFPFIPSDEDIHMAVERRLTELAGSAGEKLQTGRSRNDQVGTSLRLYLRREGLRTLESIRLLMGVLVQRATDEMETPMPGLTHLQPAQAISLGHYLMSFFWALERDMERVRAALRRVDRLPLGSGALAGSTLPVDRIRLARDLGFTRITENSLDAVSDRDMVAELSFALAQMLVHLSRYAEDWILWSNPHWGFLDLPDHLATGSSLMPQKKNPDSLELIRGKAAGAIAQVTAILSLQKGLPSSYNKDLQEDRQGLFALLDTSWHCLEVLRRVVSGCRFNRERLSAALTDDLYATDLADYLVRKGMPFRQAHEVVGRLVRHSIKTGTSLSRLPVAVFRDHSTLFGTDVGLLFSPQASLARRNLPGGTGPDSVAAQIRAAHTILGLVPGSTHARTGARSGRGAASGGGAAGRPRSRSHPAPPSIARRVEALRSSAAGPAPAGATRTRRRAP